MIQKILLSVLVICSLGSCSLDYYLDKKEERIIGVWEFEKVTFKAEGDLFSDNITSLYRNDIVEFFPDYTAIYDDFSLGAVFDGEWLVFADEDTFFNGESSETQREYFVDAEFFDFVNGEDFALFGSIDRLDRRVMRLEAIDRSGRYAFKLRKL